MYLVAFLSARPVALASALCVDKRIDLTGGGLQIKTAKGAGADKAALEPLIKQLGEAKVRATQPASPPTAALDVLMASGPREHHGRLSVGIQVEYKVTTGEDWPVVSSNSKKKKKKK